MFDMDRRTFLASATGAAAVALTGCLDTLTAEPGDSEWDVGMSSSKFSPPSIEVSVGTTVTWRNTSRPGHTVTAYEEQIPDGATYFASGGFESEEAAREGWQNGFEGRLDAGEEFEHTFETPGSYTYFCIPHEQAGMVGTVKVTDGSDD